MSESPGAPEPNPRAEDMAVMAERLGDALATSQRLGTEGSLDAKAAHDRAVLAGDAKWALLHLIEADEATQRRLIDIVGDLLQGAGPDAEQFLRAVHRVKYHLARRKMLPELVEFVRAERAGDLNKARSVRRGLHYYGDYPFRTDGAVRIPRETYRLSKELKLRAKVDRVEWEGSTLHLGGIAYISLLDFASPRDGRIRLSLVPEDGGQTIDLPVRRTHRPDVTAGSSDAAYTYDWAGFAATVDVAQLRDKNGLRPCTWRLRVWIRRGLIRRQRLVTTLSHYAGRPDFLDVEDGFRVVATDEGDDFRVSVMRPPVIVDSAQQSGDALVLRGRSATRSGSHASSAFTREIPLDSITARSRFPQLHAAADLRDVVVDDGDSQVVVTASPAGMLLVSRRPPAQLLQDVSWPPGGPIRLEIHSPGGDGTGQVLLRGSRARRDQVVDTLAVPGGVAAELRPEAVSTLAGTLPLSRGAWQIEVAGRTGNEPVLVTGHAARELPIERELGGRRFTLSQLDGRLRLVSGSDLRVDERGAVNRRRLETIDFPAFLTQGIRDEVLFESYQSRAYGDNARAIYEELARRDTGIACRWVTVDGQTELPDGLDALRRGSREYYEALARARYVIVPNYRPLDSWMTTPKDQVVVQTWHGAPFKRIGLDNERSKKSNSPSYVASLRRESARWDYLLSPNPPSTEILRGAFAFDGEVLETGYPRADVFFRPDVDAIAARVRSRLAIPEGKRIVLYAPTIRDDQRYGGNRFTLDLQLDLDAARRALADDHVLLIRRHTKVVDTVVEADGEFVRDVSLWPDVNELMTAVDVLISDYSSLVFDFATTGRPALFFTYDLERYRDDLRGFYFDAQRLPGPLLMTSDDVVAGIRDADRIRVDYDDTYRRFVADFCTWDDGAAAARFVDRVFEVT